MAPSKFSILADLEKAELDREYLATQVDILAGQALEAGASYSEIAQILHMTRQGAQNRYREAGTVKRSGRVPLWHTEQARAGRVGESHPSTKSPDTGQSVKTRPSGRAARGPDTPTGARKAAVTGSDAAKRPIPHVLDPPEGENRQAWHDEVLVAGITGQTVIEVVPNREEQREALRAAKRAAKTPPATPTSSRRRPARGK